MVGTSYSSSDESFSAYDSDEEEEETTSEANPELSARLIEALSPTGVMFGTLWPIIIENADREQRVLCLCYVNQFFAGVVRRVTSDCAKRNYFIMESRTLQAPRPVHLDLDLLKDVEWSCWGAKHLEFKLIGNFCEFCDLADVDPDKGAFKHDAQLLLGGRPREPTPFDMHWVFISRSRDIIPETGTRNPNLEMEAYAHNFGITGRADKVKRLFQHAMESRKLRKMRWSYILWGIRRFI